MEYKQHVLVAERLLQSDVGFYGIPFAFAIFSFFQIRFQLSLLHETKYKIFQNLAFLPKREFLKFHLIVWLQTYFALCIYTLFISWIGLGLGTWFRVAFLWLILFLIFSISLSIMVRKVRKAIPERIIRRSRLFPIAPYSLWFFTHLKSNRPLLLLGIKALSILLLNGFLYSYSSGSYDLRWIQFGLICAAGIHIPIWLDKVEFDQDHLSNFRNLPRTFLSKLKDHLLNGTLLLFPEILMIVFAFGFQDLRVDTLLLLNYWFALNLGIFGLIELKRANSDWGKIAMISFFILFILTIYSTPIVLISVFLFVFFFRGIRSAYSI